MSDYYKPSYPEGMTCAGDRHRCFFNGRCTECGAASSTYWAKDSMKMEQKLVDEVNRLRGMAKRLASCDPLCTPRSYGEPGLVTCKLCGRNTGMDDMKSEEHDEQCPYRTAVDLIR